MSLGLRCPLPSDYFLRQPQYMRPLSSLRLPRAIAFRRLRVLRQPPPAAATRPLGGTSSQEEVRAEDDEILRQLQSTLARISIWSLLASSSTHRDALTRALSQIRGDTTTTPRDSFHMMTVGRATCIVFYDDDLPPEGSDHTRPIYISVGCSGRRVPSVLLDNGSALNVCPLATAIALGYAPSIFGPSTQTVRAYDSTHREVMGTLEIELLIGSLVQSAGDMFISLSPCSRSAIAIRLTADRVHFCDEHGSTVVLDMMRDMSYLPGMGLGRRQHGPSEFITIPDHDEPSRLLCEASEPHASSDGIIRGLSTTQEAELHASSSMDGAAPHDEYIDEMLALSLSQIEETIQPGLASSFDLFGVFAIELAEESLTAPALELLRTL
ncbi:hypothetical protein CK203_099195 [Vitis vinifera]|uniref:Uncharacterized protein n=1 Tax=Vitis vinifera TaxID=29760 RepID=A0A438DMM3_VITVI|nr:hypothetical protein CK203_099195 [Vitis vinifera]